MKLKFCGAARNVTGSCHLVELDNGYKILLDCGMFQGDGKKSWAKNNTWHFDPKEIDCIVLSHAHIDHSGRIPKLVKEGFNGRIYSTHASRSLCSIMLLDSARIQERDAAWYNERIQKKLKKKKNKKKKLEFREPLYEAEDVKKTMDLFLGCPYESWHHINDNIQVLFTDQGHILGSASVTLKINENGKETIIGFTGDIGRPDRPILRDPKTQPEVDYLICESTYGDKNHESKPEQTDKFLNILYSTCIENKGKLIIPAFSIGRTQELIYMMDKLTNENKLPQVQVYVDSPLAVSATDIYGMHSECFDNDLHEYMIVDDNPFGFKRLNYVRSVEVSKELNISKEPCVIISASGMMNAGRIRHHMFHNLSDPKNTFLIVGYCSPDTAGSILKKGVEEIKIFGEMIAVNANIETMDSFSAHGDRDEMFHNIKNQVDGLKNLFLVHGEYDTQVVFKKYLTEKGFGQISIPHEGEEFVID